MGVSPAKAGSFSPGVLELEPLPCILFDAPFNNTLAFNQFYHSVSFQILLMLTWKLNLIVSFVINTTLSKTVTLTLA